ncbi:MAG TPA: MXAN_5187 C-terminal domain-containing protein [Thermodesulfobacteriota bacterium]
MGIPEDIAQLERQIRELKAQYEKYFSGLEKREPLRLREEVARVIRRYSGITLTNTGHAFRLSQLTANFNALSAYWTRVSQQIEEGTYARDKFRLKLKERQRGETTTAKPAAQPAEAEGPVRFRDGVEPGGREIETLYRQLLAAKKQAGEPTAGLKPEVLAATIKQQLPQIARKFGAHAVEFRVVVEGGKAKLKATPR